MALYTLKSRDEALLPLANYNGDNTWVRNQMSSLGYVPTPAQTQVYSALGRTTGAEGNGGSNFFEKRGRSIENAFGTTGSSIVSAVNDRIENDKTTQMLKDNKTRMNDIAKKYGFNSWSDWQDANAAARESGDTEAIKRFDTQLKEFQAQANANATKANEKAANYEDYRKNDYISNKINQDQGKFAGSAINTLSTAVDVTGLGATPVSNAIQGGIEGVADELEQNGFENFDWGRAGQNAAIGATTGLVTGALNKGISNSLAKNGGNLFKGGNALTRGLNNLGSKTAVGRGVSTIASGAARGAVSGAVGGATGAGLQSAMNGVDFGQGVQNALQGAVQGAQQGAVTGGIMAGANAAFGKTNFGKQLQNAKTNWDQSGSNFDERLTNTLTSGDSRVGDWIMNKRQSNILGAAGSLGNRVQDVSDLQTMLTDIRQRAEKLDANRDDYGMPDESWRSDAYGYEELLNNPQTRKVIDSLELTHNPTAAQAAAITQYLRDNGYLDTPTTAKGWAKKAGQRIVEDINNSNLGNRIKDTSLGQYENDPESRVKLISEIAERAETLKSQPRGKYGTNSWDNDLFEYPDIDEKVLNTLGISGDLDGPRAAAVTQVLKEKGIIPDGNSTPTTAKGWVKKAGQRIVEDINNSNLGNRVKDISSEGDLNNLLRKINNRATELDNIRKNNNPFNYLPDKSWSSDYDDFNELVSNPQTRQIIEDLGLTTEPRDYQTAAAMAQVLREQGYIPSTDTPTTAAGWAKKAGQRIVEDVNNSNLGNRVKDVSSDMPEDIRNMQIRDYNANADGEVPETLKLYRGISAPDEKTLNSYIEAMRDQGTAPRSYGGGVGTEGDGYYFTPSRDLAEYYANKSGLPSKAILEIEAPANKFTQMSKALGNRPADFDAAAVARGIPESERYATGLQDFNDYLDENGYWGVTGTGENPTYTILRNDAVQNMRVLGDEPTSTSTTRLTQPTQVDPWDRVAQEAGYRNYDEVLQRYAEANPNAKINPRGMAGQVLTWMDQNPNTPTTAAGWAKRAGQRAVEDINNSNLGLKVQDISQDDPSKRLYNALAGSRQPVAETEVETEADMGTIPSKTSKESRLRYARGKELVAQYGTVDQPMARATNAVKTFQRISDMGFEDPTDVEFMANAITGSNGYVSTLNKNIIKSAKPVDTFTGDGGQTLDEFIDNSIAVNKLSGLNEGVAVKRSIDAYLKSLPSRAEGSVDYKDSAADTFKVVQGLEASAAELEGRGGSTYHRADTVDLHQAAVLKDVANLLKDRIYDGSNAKIAITPQVVKEMKALAPDNEKWSATVDDFAKNVKTPQDLRRFQEPFVKAGRYIDNQYVQAATVGGRMAANAGELPTVLRTTKAGIINDLVNRAWNSNMAHRGRAALYGKLADRAAEKAANNPTTAKGWAKQAGQRAAEDLGNTNLGNRIQDVSGQPVNPQVATPAELANTVADYNPSTQLYNAIGRTEGAIAQETPAQYLAEAAQEAEVVEPLEYATTPNNTIAPSTNTGSTAVYDTLNGTQTATGTTMGNTTRATGNTGYFQPTGDYWTDIIASALSSAIEDRDVAAFTELYNMYQTAISNLNKTNEKDYSNPTNWTSSDRSKLLSAQNGLDQISQLENAYVNATGEGGSNAIQGWLRSRAADISGGNWDPSASNYNKLAESVGLGIIKNLVNLGVQKEDAERYKQYLPALTDTKEQAEEKLATLRSIYQSEINNLYSAYGV